MKKLIPFLFLILPFSITAQLKEGNWEGNLILNDSLLIKLPLRIQIEKVKGQLTFSFLNAEEKITVENLKFKKDSVFFRMPVFDSEFKCLKIGDNRLKGIWVNKSRSTKNKINFEAQHKEVEPIIEENFTDMSGKWESTFSPNTLDSSKAIGIFKQYKNNLSGTFLTETGDYRYLEGKQINNQFYLSCFDGSHAFLFKGIIEQGNIKGEFYSGSHWKENWIAIKNNQFELRDPESITLLKDPQQAFYFKFNNTNGNPISINDDKYVGKVVIVQIMGSWCPNCMDETKYLAELHKKYQAQGLEIIAVAFEKINDIKKAQENVTRLKNKYNAQYEFLITGMNGKDKASQTFSNLNAITAFPTTIFLDKNKMIRNIHTGFNGPATGNRYEIFKEKTEILVEALLKE